MKRLIFSCLTVILVLTGCGQTHRATQPATPRASSRASTARPLSSNHIRTVFLILMENHNWSSIKGNPSAPYINGTLLPMGSHAERYYNPPGIHPSLPNYLWLEAGTNFNVHFDLPPHLAQQNTTNHLVALLDRARIPWRAYQQGISGQSCPLASAGDYAPRHNPFVYFTDVSSRPAYCRSHERPYTQLSADLSKNAVARYNFITADLCHDMHDSCAPYFDPVRQGDRWLSTAIPAILRSRAYKQGGAIFITWDEGEGRDGPIGMIVLSPEAKGHGYIGYQHYTHSSTLRTMEEIFHVKPLLRDATNANDLRDLFKRFP